MGSAALDYVRARPEEFFSLFPEHIEWQALSIWSDMIAQELIITSEDASVEAANSLAIEIARNCTGRGDPKAADIERLRLQIIARLMELNSL